MAEVEESPALSVVIPTAGGRARVLARSIETLLRDEATAEVIVVLDRVDVATQDLVRSLQARDSRVRVAEANQGAARDELDRGQRSRTAGVRVARSEVILALDDDVEPADGLARGHARRHSNRDDLVVVGYMPVAAPTEQAGASPAATRIYSQAYERACSAYRANPERILLGLWGGNLSVRRDHWLASERAAGETVTGAYHADLDFGLRLRTRGLHGVFDSDLRATHHYRRSVRLVLADAVSAGVGRARLRAAHPELYLFEAPDEGRFALRSLLWRGSGRRWRLASEALILAASVSTSLRMPRLEDLLVRAVWTVGVGRGGYLAS